MKRRAGRPPCIRAKDAVNSRDRWRASNRNPIPGNASVRDQMWGFNKEGSPVPSKHPIEIKRIREAP